MLALKIHEYTRDIKKLEHFCVLVIQCFGGIKWKSLCKDTALVHGAEEIKKQTTTKPKVFYS